ncbi:phage terminase large subunit [Giesbergeria sinuosa]
MWLAWSKMGVPMACPVSEVDDLAMKLDDPMWRLSNLYKIIIKGDEGDEGSPGDDLVITFKPNRAQRRLIARLHHRNIILKARQLGFTTLVCILWLDTALFSKAPIRCGIVAQDREAAEAIFRGKVLFAYDQLPEELKAQMPFAKRTANEIEFAHNGSSIRVATSMRSGTIHRLHISEFGKICAKYPEKAQEVVTGSIPAVPLSGICIIESTAEGQDGKFYDMTQRAKALAEQRAHLTPKDYRFHFFAWWQAPEYSIDPTGVVFTEANNAYFSEVEAKIGRELTQGQRAWYVTTLNSDFSGDAPLMWQEYPSTPEEAFQVSTEGCYYASQLSTARKQGRILPALPMEAAPVNTFWDIGRGDMTAIWCHQRVGPENRWIRYYEASGEDLIHFVGWLQKLGVAFGTHYLPHDAGYKRMGETPDTNKNIKEMLEGLMPGQRFDIVPRVTSTISGIQSTRNQFSSCWFDEAGCGDGIKRLANYRKVWNTKMGRWSSEPLHDNNSHGADAFRQFGQVAEGGERFQSGAVARTEQSVRRRRSGMAA